LTTKRNSSLFELEKRAQSDDPEAQYLLAEKYYDGDGVEQSYKEAFKWYSLAAAKGHIVAKAYLGYAYLRGIGVKKSNRLALQWFKKAARSNYPYAQFNIGMFHFFGIKTPQDYHKANHWFKKAAGGGQPQAQYMLALAYCRGIGVRRNAKLAFYWFRQAARLLCRIMLKPSTNLVEHTHQDSESNKITGWLLTGSKRRRAPEMPRLKVGLLYVTMEEKG
jgi:hypothetical protein